MKNYKNHNVNSPLLIGNIKDGDVIKDATQESYIDNTLTLF